MRHKKISVITMLIIFLFTSSYPQAMLINEKTKSDKKIEIVDKVIKSTEKVLEIDVEIPQINGLNDKTKEKEFNDLIVKWTEDWIKDIKQITKENFYPGLSTAFPYQAVAKYKVGRNDERVLSLYIDYYQFTGGAHGITTRKAYSLDIDSGKILSIKDLFKTDYKYDEAINSEIRKQIETDKDKYFSGKEGFNGISENQNYYLVDDSIVIYFQQYEIAPYAAGIVEFNIPVELFENNYIYGKIVDK